MQSLAARTGTSLRSCPQVSDLHVDHAANLAWMREWPTRADDALVVAGDICTHMRSLRDALRVLAAKFKHVFCADAALELGCPHARLAASPTRVRAARRLCG